MKAILKRIVGFSLLIWLGTIAFTASESFIWDPNSEPDVAGYRIYYKTLTDTSHQMIDVGNVTRGTVSGLISGETYRFFATCYNTAGLESDPSNVVELTIPDEPKRPNPPILRIEDE